MLFKRFRKTEEERAEEARAAEEAVTEETVETEEPAEEPLETETEEPKEEPVETETEEPHEEKTVEAEESEEEPAETETEAPVEEPAETEEPEEEPAEEEIPVEAEEPEEEPAEAEEPAETAEPEEPAESEPEPESEKPSMSFFGGLGRRIKEALGMASEVTEEFYEDLEEILITSDVGMDTTQSIVFQTRMEQQDERIRTLDGMQDAIRRVITGKVDKGERNKVTAERPLVILMVGINGGGKTTTIGKLGWKYKNEGQSVLFVAGDTFRAAAADQLAIWADRVGVPIISHAEGADPSAVLYDGLESAKARGTDVVICDTAGRLQNKKNLMAELEKMNRIIDKQYPEAARETLLVLDATTGKNAISQVEQFGDVTALTGVVITKLDGTAKGGIAITIANQFDLPIKFIGVGEKMEDLREFDAEAFIGGIFDE